MNIHNELAGDVTVLRLNGRLEPASALALSQTLDELIAKGNTKILLDMKNLTFVSSSGLGVLVMSNIKLKEKGGSLKLVLMSQNLRYSTIMKGR
jgi:anti-sigma B factor antagonist